MPTPLTVSADHGFSTAQAALSGMPWTTSSAQDRLDRSSAVQCGPLLHFAANGEIYCEGDEAKSFYKVLSGVVRTCKFLNDGRRQIDAFYGAGDVFGIEVGLEHRLSAEAVADCTVVSYRRRNLETLATTDDRLARHFFSYAMQCLERAQKHSLLLGRRGATEKLAAFLLEMADRNPEDEVIDLAMTRQDIADYLGLTIETVSRTLSQLERDAVIALPAARRIRLKNRAALQRFNS
jgi:CRP/FNR family transcriptional regulator, nitrogen fixation regulation protein